MFTHASTDSAVDTCVSPAPDGAGEVWRAVVGGEGRYLVSNRRRVWSVRTGGPLAASGGRVVLRLADGLAWRTVGGLVAAAFGGSVRDCVE